MSLFAIADPHLSFNTSKSMDVFPGWSDYTVRLEKNWRSLVEPEDTVVIAGDISGNGSAGSGSGFCFYRPPCPDGKSFSKAIMIIGGPHEKKWMIFCASRASPPFISSTTTLIRWTMWRCAGLADGFSTPRTLQTTKYCCGKLGGCAHQSRPLKRTGLEPVAFLHYPPVCGGQACEEIFSVLREEGIRRCYYGHLHGPGIRHAFQGEREGIRMKLISCDALAFCPLLVQ